MTHASFYKWAENHMSIDETDEGQLVCNVPSQDGCWYTVSVDESSTVPTPTGCTCRHHKQHGTCSHVDIVTRFYARIYRSNVQKVAAKVEQEQETMAVIAEAESIIKTSSIELAAKKRAAGLPRNQGFSILKR